ncbi:dnmA, DNA (cytosine-5-)-methyltransferase [Tieghemostelium lacteum]|uniref:DnmA, DNA (Cytosine-5-)-methyltransferase n=1 Tax=Tieghemostelium lacteum TaxID=361077 RepID=A0A151Z7H4_TIELA|nr:dnmA, DNA (cytosine-5-)-methyltransferase [Tieghemostelium lacteum]|eukprot:KYQ89885.1 dnmA, DNA (cytosine-5-)-methyltransferase [Tieghemostelium lacteum]
MNNEEELRVLEFYSGIGGMHYGLLESKLKFKVIQSFDINTNANANYLHTFKEKVNQKSIDSLTLKELESYNSNMWTMSPPCQPFTRNGLQLDDKDNRTNSFLHLLEQLVKLDKLAPTYILIENVFGFEKSNTRQQLIETLKTLNYTYQEFILSPQSFFIPNQRTRYFLVASRNPLRNCSISPDIQLSIPGYKHSTDLMECNQIQEYLDSNSTEEGHYQKYQIPMDILQSKGMLLDIKQATDRTTNCYTRAYGKYIEGTGSVLQTDTRFQAEIDNNQSLIPLKLRYFSAKEITRLHGFPETFEFHPSFTSLQQYRLIGNSLNVKIISQLLLYLFSNKQ